MNQELYSLGIMLFISCSALIGAINSRGTVKMVLSYILAFICLAGTGFLGGQYISQMSEKKAVKFEESNKALEQKVEQMQQVLEETLKEEEGDAQAIAAYKKEAFAILLQAQKVADRLSGYKLPVTSDAAYEEAVKRANYYLSETRKYHKSAKGLTPPESMEATHQKFLKGVETINVAVSSMRRFYTAENSEEEQDIINVFNYKVRQAKDMLNQSEPELQ